VINAWAFLNYWGAHAWAHVSKSYTRETYHAY